MRCTVPRALLLLLAATLSPTLALSGEYQVERETISEGRNQVTGLGLHQESHVSALAQRALPSPGDGQSVPSSLLSAFGPVPPAHLPKGAPVPRSGRMQDHRAPLVDSHFLRYFTTAFYNPGYGEPRIRVVGYVDNTQISSFDSDNESQRVEPRVPFMAQDPEHLDELTRLLRRILIIGRIELRALFNYRSKRANGERP